MTQLFTAHFYLDRNGGFCATVEETVEGEPSRFTVGPFTGFGLLLRHIEDMNDRRQHYLMASKNNGSVSGAGHHLPIHPDDIKELTTDQLSERIGWRVENRVFPLWRSSCECGICGNKTDTVAVLSDFPRGLPVCVSCGQFLVDRYGYRRQRYVPAAQAGHQMGVGKDEIRPWYPAVRRG